MKKLLRHVILYPLQIVSRHFSWKFIYCCSLVASRPTIEIYDPNVMHIHANKKSRKHKSFDTLDHWFKRCLKHKILSFKRIQWQLAPSSCERWNVKLLMCKPELNRIFHVDLPTVLLNSQHLHALDCASFRSRTILCPSLSPTRSFHALIAAERSSALCSTPTGFCFEEKIMTLKRDYLQLKTYIHNYDDEAMRSV